MIHLIKTALLGLFMSLTATLAHAVDPVYTGFFSNDAVSGYDTVAYFTQGKPVKGSDDFKTEWNGVVWKFSSAEHLALFTENPEKYAPQYGGYCAWAVSQNDTASADPNNWTIVDGKLYLNYNDEVQARWEGNIAGFIQQADKHWPDLHP